MRPVTRYGKGPGVVGYNVRCPGCGEVHFLRTVQTDQANPKPLWTFDGNMKEPTFSPSVKRDAVHVDPPSVCHFFLTAGRFNFQSDSTHHLAGVSGVPMLRDES